MLIYCKSALNSLKEGLQTEFEQETKDQFNNNELNNGFKQEISDIKASKSKLKPEEVLIEEKSKSDKSESNSIEQLLKDSKKEINTKINQLDSKIRTEIIWIYIMLTILSIFNMHNYFQYA